MTSEETKALKEVRTPKTQKILDKIDSTRVDSQRVHFPLETISPAEEERYQIVKTLGEGGMGLVQLAQDSVLQREVALKTIKTDRVQKDGLNKKQEMLLWRLKKEAEITAVLEHPNIVPLYDLQKKKNGEVYFTMRKIQGETLASLLKKKKQGIRDLDQDDLLTIFSKVCDAVAYAHSQGILHRDLKPENVMVGQFGEVYVMDWGIAKRISNPINATKEELSASQQETESALSEDEQTKTKEVLKSAKDEFKTLGGIGTIGYMAPEQSLGHENLREQADIHALGKILKQCFTYISPIEEFQEVIAQRQNLIWATQKNASQKESAKKQELPEDIQAIVEKAIQKNWSERYSSVREFALDIERYRKNLRVSVRNYSVLQLLWKWAKRNQIAVSMVSLVFAIFISFWGYLTYQERQEFNSNLTQAQIEQRNGIAKENREEKMDHWLKGLYAADTALLIAPQDSEVAKVKYELSRSLIQSACETRDFQFASYFVRGVERLETLASQEKTELKKEVELAKTRSLREHQERLRYWKRALKDPSAGMREEAVLEISKMEEPEILEELARELQAGTQYFLTSSERNLKENEYYETIVNAIGSLGNPKAGPILWSSIESIAEQVLRFKEGNRPDSDVQYMVILVQALSNSKAIGFSERLKKLRRQMGETSPFIKRTAMSFNKLVLLENLLAKRQGNSFEVLIDRAQLKSEMDDLDGAIQDYTEAIQLNPQFYQAYHNRGSLRNTRGDIDGAFLDYNEAIRLNPEFASAYLNRGSIKRDQGDIEGAILDYNEAIRLNPEFAAAYFNRGGAKENKGDIDGAIEDYNEAIRLNPQFAEFYNNRGLTKKAKKDFEGAIQDFTESIRLNPQNTFPYTNRGLTRKDQGDIEGAIQDLTKAIQLDPQFARGYHNRGIAKQESNDFVGAIMDYTEAIRLNPQFYYAYCSRGIIKKEKGDLDGAIQDFAEAIRLRPQEAFPYPHRGVCRQAKGDLDGAISDFTEAIRLNLQDSKVYYARGLAKKEKRDLDGAILDFTEAIRLNPKDSLFYINRGSCRQTKKDWNGAIQDYTEAVRLNPQESQSYYSLGILKREKGDWKGALQDYTEAIRLNPQFAFAYTNRGIIKKEDQGDLEGAIQDCTEAIRINPQLLEAYICRGRTRKQKGDIDGALQDFTEMIRLSPQNSEFYFDRGLLREKKRDLHGAIQDYTDVVRLNPKYAEAYTNRGILRKDLGDIDGSIEDYTEAIRVKPQLLNAHVNRGIAKQAKGDILGALEDFENGLKLQAHPELIKLILNILKQQSREALTQKDWVKAKFSILKLKQYLPVNDPQQKQLEQKLQQLESLLESKEKK